MKKFLLVMAALALVVALALTSYAAEGKMKLSAGGDVLLPMGIMKDGFSSGFGGSVRFQYDVSPMASIGGTVGYFTWSAKDLGGNLGTGPSFKGIPLRVFGKYYFMPEGKARVYGIAEAGVFFGSSGDYTAPSIPVSGVVTFAVTTPGSSSTGFNYAPGIGVEVPLGEGKTSLDISARWDGNTMGSSANNVAARVGVTFPLGQ